jgi:hypothetical protein
MAAIFENLVHNQRACSPHPRPTHCDQRSTRAMAVTEDSEPDRGASLARLRLFLAPHAPPPTRSTNKPDVPPPAPSDTQANSQQADVDDATSDHAHVVDGSDSKADPQANGSLAQPQAAPLTESSASDVLITASHASPMVDHDFHPIPDHDARQNTITTTGGAAASVRSLSPASKEYARVKYLLQVGTACSVTTLLETLKMLTLGFRACSVASQEGA